MTRARPLFDILVDPAHLARAARLTMRGKRSRPDVGRFLVDRLGHLAALRRALIDGTWAPEGFDLLRIRDPKPRIIARAPLIDRVVHTALVEALRPRFDRSLMPGDYACRPGFGTHRAVRRLQMFMQSHRFAVHLDVKACFPSTDITILSALVRRRVRDARFLAVLERVLAGGPPLYRLPAVRRHARLTDDWPPPGRGLPIGASTSQYLVTHLYLGGLDHHVKRALKAPGWLRYVDDQFVFGDRRADLRRWRAAIGEWLWTERGLKLKHPEARVLSCAGHLDALGYRITRAGITPHKRALRRLEARLRVAQHDPRAAVDEGLRRSIAATTGAVLFR